MSNINVLFGKDYEHKLNDECSIKIKPFKVSDFGKLKSLENDADGTKSVALVDEILLYNFPESTKEQRDEVGMSYLTKIMQGLFLANNLKVPKELEE